MSDKSEAREALIGTNSGLGLFCTSALWFSIAYSPHIDQCGLLAQLGIDGWNFIPALVLGLYALGLGVIAHGLIKALGKLFSGSFREVGESFDYQEIFRDCYRIAPRLFVFTCVVFLFFLWTITSRYQYQLREVDVQGYSTEEASVHDRLTGNDFLQVRKPNELCADR